MFKPNRENLAWVTRVFDGEGSISIGYRYKLKSGVVKGYPIVRMPQSGIDALVVLNKFQETVASLGRIYGPRKSSHAQKLETYVLQFHGFKECQAVIGMLWEFLSNKKRNQYLNIIQQHLI